MGVHGLWDLIGSVGHPIELESLSNKILAIDASIWINQSIKGMRDKNGRPVDNAHILGFYHRICKLLFYKIKPIFVFDGAVPMLKRQTIAARHETRLKAINKSRHAAAKILQSYVSSQMSAPIDNIKINHLPELTSALLPASGSRRIDKSDDIFQLPSEDKPNHDETESDDDYDPALEFKYFEDLDSVDIESESFKTLPPHVRHELLSAMKERSKGWRRSKEQFPKDSNDFSRYQMTRLLKKRNIQKGIENSEKEMKSQISDGFGLNYLNDPASGKGIIDSGRLVSDENTHYILMKKSQNDLKINLKINETETTKSDELNPNAKCHLLDSDSDDVNNGDKMDERNIKDKDYHSHESTENEQTNDMLNLNLNTLIEENSKSCDEISDFMSKNQEILPKNLFNSTIDISSDDTFDNDDSIVISETNSQLKHNNKETNISIVEIDTDKDDDDDDVWGDTKDSFDVYIENLNEEDIKIITKESVSIENADENVIESPLKRFTFKNSEQNKDESKDVCVVTIDSPSKAQCDPLFSDIFGSPSKKSPEKQLELSKSPVKAQTLQIIHDEQHIELRKEMNRQERYANKTTDKMVEECQNLLTLFGIPFIVSPMEAEAQCAKLEELSLTQGTITDDSDILLFGAKNVYKNFFTQSKYVELYKDEDITNNFGFTRSSLICIAMLTGSDYTEGIENVGVVKATEILSEFPGEGLEPLVKFKEWWNHKRNSNDKRPENKTRSNLMKLMLNEGFPNKVIYDAYINPSVDESQETFSWGIPQLDSLRTFASERFGWNKQKIDDILLPVMKKVNEKHVQTRIDSYFKVQNQPKDSNSNVQSKRLIKALDKMRGIETEKISVKVNNVNKGNLQTKVKNQRRKRNTNTRKGSESNETVDNSKKIKFTNLKNKRNAKLRAESAITRTLQLSESSESEEI